MEQAFEHATNTLVRGLLNGARRFEALRSVYENIPTITWAYVAPMNELSFRMARDIENDILGATTNQTSEGDAEEDKSHMRSSEEALEPEAPSFAGDGMVVDGYKSLLIDHLANDDGDVLDIKYKRVVTAVHLKPDSNDITPFGERSSRGVSCVVKCQNGEEFKCDYVVVTVPLGVLKKRRISFDPPLSSRKEKAIRALGMGTENKVYMRFADSFWPKSRFWQVTDRRYRFLNLHAYGKTNTIVAHIAPPHAHDFDGQSSSQVVEELCRVLQRMFKLKELPVPIQSIVTRWAQDEHSYGAYSYMPVGSTFEDVKALASTEYNGRVYFAGEACHVDAAQCVHGAVITGNIAAMSILTLGDVPIDYDKLVGGSAGDHRVEKDRTALCSRCKKVRPIPLDVEVNEFWTCAHGGLWNSSLGNRGCDYGKTTGKGR
jgi:hypothetical protein